MKVKGLQEGNFDCICIVNMVPSKMFCACVFYRKIGEIKVGQSPSSSTPVTIF